MAWLVDEIFAENDYIYFFLLKDQNEQFQESEMDRHHPSGFRYVASASIVQSTAQPLQLS
jgi:citrate lyase synthetase